MGGYKTKKAGISARPVLIGNRKFTFAPMRR